MIAGPELRPHDKSPGPANRSAPNGSSVAGLRTCRGATLPKTYEQASNPAGAKRGPVAPVTPPSGPASGPQTMTNARSVTDNNGKRMPSWTTLLYRPPHVGRLPRKLS